MNVVIEALLSLLSSLRSLEAVSISGVHVVVCFCLQLILRPDSLTDCYAALLPAFVGVSA